MCGCVGVEGSGPASSFWALFWHPSVLCNLGIAQSPPDEQYVCSIACLLGQNMIPDMLWLEASFTLKTAKIPSAHY